MLLTTTNYLQQLNENKQFNHQSFETKTILDRSLRFPPQDLLRVRQELSSKTFRSPTFPPRAYWLGVHTRTNNTEQK